MSEWQPIHGYAGRYEVSTDGDVRQVGGRPCGQWTNGQGYRVVRLSKPRAQARVHRLVAMAFIPNPNNYPVVNHIDCCPSNNEASNLEWCTHAANLYHSAALGRMQRDYWKGRRSPNASISDEAANLIRREYSTGQYSWMSLAEKFSTNKRTVGRIIRGETYAR